MRRFFLRLGLSLCCVLTWPLVSVQAETHIRVGQYLDLERGTWIRDRVIVVNEDGRISEIRNAADTPSTAGDIDLSTGYVVPGLIDLHVHLTSSADVHGYRRLSRSVSRAAIDGVVAAQDTLRAGFTTVRNVGAGGFADVALRDAIDEGAILGPRMRVSGPSLCITGGHCDGALLAPEFKNQSDGAANGPWAVREKVRRNIKYGADLIKFSASGGVLSKGTDVNAAQFHLDEMRAIVNEAHDRGRRVAAHAHGKRGILRAIEAGVDSVEHASFIDKKGIALAKKRGTALVMDIYVTDYILSTGEAAGILPESLEKERQVGQRQRENFRAAHRSGAKIVFGTDAGVYPHGDNAKQFRIMVAWGMSPLDAIRSATTVAAEVLDWRGSNGDLLVGELVPGRFADLVHVKENPLENIRALESVASVVKGGKLIEPK